MEKDPITRFNETLTRAANAGIELHDAVAMASTGADGKPSVRMVLLKHADSNGFVFYTNLESRKATQLSENPNVGLCFWWRDLTEQIRVEGRVQRVSDAEADEYFSTRPRGSQLSAWASKQSSTLESRQELLDNFDKMKQRFKDQEVPRPPFWSGFRLVPDTIEFWFGREERLHERILYTKVGDGWETTVLSP